MSLQNSFNKIRRNAGIKKCVMIDGNVGDVYLDDKNKIVTLREFLEAMFKDMDYQDIVYWDRVEGATGAIDKLTLTDEVEVEGDAYDLGDEEEETPKAQQGLFKSPAEILNVVYKNVIDKKKKVAFIINWSEYLFSANGLSEDERQNITLLGKALKDRKIDYLSSDCNESVVVIILNKASGLPLSFYQGNPEVEIVTLQKPDREERKQMVQKIEDSFEVRLKSGTSSLLDNENIDCIDMMEDFTNREIIQLSRMSRKEDKMSFDKLFYLFKYGEKENPWEKLEQARVKNIKKELADRVVGQDEAIEKIEKTVVKAYMGLTGLHKTSSRSMPKGVFFFVGPTGVGKTELSKALAKFLFGDEQACIRFDMSEYAQENSDQKLIGAAPGYVGYEEGGQLTNAIKEHPFSVVLFDEIEKAAKPNPRILDIFLQILEDGRLTDSKGETVYFSDTIIVFTSNLGANQVQASADKEGVAKEFIRIVKEYFDQELKRPELLGRIGYNNIVPFNFIQDKEFQYKICKSKLKPVIRGIEEKYKLDLEFEKEMDAINYILSAVDSAKGGRDILNAINDRLLDPLAMFLFENKDDLRSLRGSKIVTKVTKEGFSFEFSE
ncbi:MAG: AAA family ATPase [Bacilli bacterium]|jgi:putative atpase with chaperone activity, clp protease subunit protein|nr:AAA family ATPase [Bacilli bacterium]